MAEHNSSPEWFPAGWTTEIKVRKKGRKDKYYTDPVSGYVFRSLKDIERYLKTGELGRHAFKPKDKGHTNVELGDDKLSSHAVAQGHKLAGSGTNEQIIENQCSKLLEIVKDEEIISSDNTEDQIRLTKHDSDQRSDSAAMSSINPPQTKSLGQRVGKGDSDLHKSVSAPVVGDFPEKLLENGVGSHVSIGIQRKINKSNGKTAPDLPRRASKRLAGIEVDPAPELKTNNRARRVAARRSGEAETSSSKNLCGLDTPEEHAGKVELETMDNEKQGLPIVLPPASLPISEAQAGEEEPANKTDVKPGSPLNLSLKDLWTDPCIEFAVKTLTGAIPVGDENNGNENPGWSMDLPFGELWTDPCIEFAVKTLTGAIPVGDDLGIQNCFQLHVSSSDTQGVNGIMLPNVDNLCQSDNLSQHFDAVEKPLNKLQAPKLLHTGNVSFQNSGGNGLHQHVEGRSSGERPKSTVL